MVEEPRDRRLVRAGEDHVPATVVGGTHRRDDRHQLPLGGVGGEGLEVHAGEGEADAAALRLGEVGGATLDERGELFGGHAVTKKPASARGRKAGGRNRLGGSG